MRVLAVLLLLALATIGVAHAEAQDVIVRSKLDPATGAVPGQPVKLFVDVLFAGAMLRPPLVDVGAAPGAQILRFETQAVTIRENTDGRTTSANVSNLRCLLVAAVTSQFRLRM